MGITSILSEFQKETLLLFKKTPLAKNYYLAGGTALAEYYLHHRKSEDLDFFTQDELSLASLQKFVAGIQSRIQLDKIEYQRGFGLYTFFLYPKKEVAKYKIDFGQYPFGPINPLKKFDGLLVEDLYDIAVDKTHTISVRPRLRDFIDLFLILESHKNWSFEELLRRGQEKFEITVDPLQLGENLLQARTLGDMPIMLKDIDMKEVKKYFMAQAGKQRQKILQIDKVA
ncbi:nucleotidyl transferase AbiEii/AbiGii toxin family protein [Candidatus Collierbacteria bacterium]|nr:nucleotidyl transferase AbiEii/AbiGii toxin family protein [Candidatus Collierbacteria bacterium]